MEPGPKFNELPYEIQFETLLKVGYPNLQSFCQASSAAHALCNDERFWAALYQKDFPTIPRRSPSVKADYLRAYGLLHQWADKFAKNYSEGDPRYVSRSAQAEGVFDLMQNFLRTLPNAADWQTWANLTQEEEEEATGGGGIAEYNEEMYHQRDELANELQQILWGIDERLFQFVMEHLTNVDWGDTTMDYANEVEDILQDLFALTPRIVIKS